ncbi:proteasome assembly chaperone family protein [Serinibacter salmoneus]|uniref:Proteasome assembly chaperone (PAC2) family protein n=1 Tax=Serinibacter salmoneus TaxID=556530 RepID=A0A2A9CYA3_9MICO|nr:PAC2 family protein [Serinibacter salmoneus]PFG19373.1 proteasome assembly chaperone (PAC2) family protein [Serinibacter salmoneus]
MDPQQLYRWDLAGRPGAEPRPESEGAHLAEEAPAPSAQSDTPPAGAPDVVAGVVGGIEDVGRRPGSVEEISATVMVHALRGSVDAGHAGALVAHHLLESHPTTRVLTFDMDGLMDYRSRRPSMTFEKGAFTDYSEPALVLDLVGTPSGDLLLLHGPEPDLHWEAFTRAVRDITTTLGVTTTVGVHGIPMGVPHTRPISVTSHATSPHLIEAEPDVFGTVQVPGSAASLLEYRFGQWGKDALGYAVHVPHYLAQSEYPAAAVELLRRVSAVSGVDLDTRALEESAASVLAEITKQIEDSSEVAAVVQALENQYDAFVQAQGRSLLDPGEMPSADELGAQFEAFLAEVDRKGDEG